MAQARLIDGKPVKKMWYVILKRAEHEGVVFLLTSGNRTLAEQKALFAQNMQFVNGRWVPKPGRPLTAFPNPSAPHIRVGKPNHALDVNSLDGGETRLEQWVEGEGADWMNTVSSESWHGELSLVDLIKLYRKVVRKNKADKKKAKKARLLKKRRARKAAKLAEQKRKAAVAKRHGIDSEAYALIAVQVQDKLKHVDAALAIALLEQESGGRNVFGHDPTIFVGAGKVTRDKYERYREQRRRSGNRMMQGVGPLQLTWWEFQDEADRKGGCWKPRVNISVGLSRLDKLIAQFGEADGIRRYNGSGPAAEAYSREVRAKADRWEARFKKGR